MLAAESAAGQIIGGIVLVAILVILFVIAVAPGKQDSRLPRDEEAQDSK